MIYALSLLLLTLGLLVGVPAMRKITYMFRIKKNSGTTMGQVISTKSAMNSARGLVSMVNATELVNHERPLVTYSAPQGREIRMEVIPSNFLSGRRYQMGESVEVVYDLSEPWRAYLAREWSTARRDFWIGTALSITGLALWILGRTYDLPF